MRNIPDFTCEYGVASLVLQEIPRSGNAYCMVVAGEAEPLLEECRRFCRMAGAERVYGLEAGRRESFRILRMAVLRESLAQTDAALWPVLPENGEEYRRIYNEAMRPIPAALSMTARDMKTARGCYFVHRGETLLGIGQAVDGELRSIVSCVPGAGRDVALALMSTLEEDRITLKVAECNTRAIRLYEKLGFIPTGVAETWYEL